MSNGYKLKYTLAMEVGDFSHEEVVAAGGGCDALFLVSCIHHEGGSYSQSFVSKDGRTGKEMSQKDIFKIWSMLGSQLRQCEELPNSQRNIAETCHKLTMEVLNQAKKKSQ